MCSGCGTANELRLDVCIACGASMASVGPGSVLSDRFELLVQVGEGGMGWVFRAHDRLLDEEVAVKVLRSAASDQLDSPERFRREIRLARRVAHPNVCRIFEYGTDAGVHFLTMEFIDGVDLVSALARREAGLARHEAFAVALKVGAGLQAIHDEEVVHRDLKSANVMIDALGEVRLLDFGIARDARGRDGMTRPGIVLGTPEYMSPEQARGLAPDRRSDIYSLGIVCYEAFTGRVPFQGSTGIGTLIRHIREPPPFEQAVELGLPEALVPPLRSALAKDPRDRHASVSDFIRAVRTAREAARTGVVARVTSIPSQERRRDRRLEIPVGCRLRFLGLDGEPEEELTVTENISRGGARVKTVREHLGTESRIELEELDGGFRVIAEVRGNRVGEDGVRRLHLKFIDHAAPDRLVGEAESSAGAS